jgi:flagellar protein FlaI
MKQSAGGSSDARTEGAGDRSSGTPREGVCDDGFGTGGVPDGAVPDVGPDDVADLLPSKRDPEEFFSTEAGDRTLVGPGDLIAALPDDDDPDGLVPLAAYWVEIPYAFVVTYLTEGDDGYRYVVVEPQLSGLERQVFEALKDRLRRRDIEEVNPSDSQDERARGIQREAERLMRRLGLHDEWVPNEGLTDRLSEAITDVTWRFLSGNPMAGDVRFTRRQRRKVTYYLTRDLVFFDRVNPILEDENVEDISCNAAGVPLFVDHASFGESVLTNVEFPDERSLQQFVIRATQEVGEGIDKRTPQVECTLPDGSRAHFTLGYEVSAHGSNFTIRQFSEIPFTPIDLINWETYDFERCAYLWMLMEEGHSALFSGGTGAGKTTSLNAFSLFIPAGEKIVSIEDTREVQLPHRNWVAGVTRDTVGESASGNIDEADLLEGSLRQRPKWIVMGEIRGEEGRELVEAMNTGHYVAGTFHSGDDRTLIKRFTQDRIDADRSALGELDVIVQQAQFQVGDDDVRRNTQIVEIEGYDATNSEYNTHETFSYRRDVDEFQPRGRSVHLESLVNEKGWTRAELEREMDRRATVLAYLVANSGEPNHLNAYSSVATVFQAYMRDPERVLGLIARDRLYEEVETLQEMREVNIDVDHEREVATHRPEPTVEVAARANAILEANSDLLADQTVGTPVLAAETRPDGWVDPVRQPTPSNATTAPTANVDILPGVDDGDRPGTDGPGVKAAGETEEGAVTDGGASSGDGVDSSAHDRAPVEGNSDPGESVEDAWDWGVPGSDTRTTGGSGTENDEADRVTQRDG